MTEHNLDAARDQAYRKIGRNIHAFQRIEAVIKFLIARSQLEGPLDHLHDVREKNDKKVLKATMGGLVEPLFSQIFADDSPENLRLEGLDRAWISMTYKLEADKGYVQDKKLKLKKLVSERNRLVHQMIGPLDINSAESCLRLCEELDAQYELIKPEYDDLHTIMAAMQTTLKEAKERLMADEPTSE